MADTLRRILDEYDNMQYATQQGSEMHRKMRAVHMENGVLVGDKSIVDNINKHPELAMFFVPASRVEVPVAAIVHGNFISRRIDRMVVDEDNKTIHVIDYKTDIDKGVFRLKYVAQVQEYVSIVKEIYPKYTVIGYILWLHDWTLEKL